MAISTLGVCIALAAATTAPAARGPVADLARGFLALRAGDFHESARALDGLPQAAAHRDYALYLLGEASSTTAPTPRRGLPFPSWPSCGLRASLLSRPGAQRIASGCRASAKMPLKRIVGCWPERRRHGSGGWRVFAWRSSLPRERRRREVPRPRRRATSPAGAPGLPRPPVGRRGGQTRAILGAASAPRPRSQCSRRFERLRRPTSWPMAASIQAALDELALLPAALPADLAIERDFTIGMAQVQHEARLCRRSGFVAEGGVPASRRESGLCGISRCARAFAHRAQRRGHCRLSPGGRALSHVEMGGRSPVPFRLAGCQSRSFSRGPAQPASHPGAATRTARLPTTPPGISRWHTTCWASRLKPCGRRALREPVPQQQRRGHALCATGGRAFTAQAGQAEEAQRSCTSACTALPLGYYGLLAAAAAARVGREGDHRLAGCGLRPRRRDKAKSARAIRLLERARELLAAGNSTLRAGEELGRGRKPA